MARSNDLSLEAFKKTLSSIQIWMNEAFQQLGQYDSLGDAKEHPKGSDERSLAEFRDAIEVGLSSSIVRLNQAIRARARVSRNTDLLVTAASEALGNVHEGLELMERFHQVCGDETSPDGTVPSETFPETFAWDTYHRVEALRELVRKYPKHIRNCARQMYGWPMIVFHHLDCTPEFERIAERLQVGAAYPLDTGRRPKRGRETPFLRYLEHHLWRVDVLRTIYHKMDPYWK